MTVPPPETERAWAGAVRPTGGEAGLGRRRLGRSGVWVTPLMLGGAPLGGLFAPVSDADARATLDAAWDAGVRAFDTAPHYGVGLSESRLGRFVATHPRPDIVVSTKVGRLLVPTDEDTDGVDGFYGTPRLRRVRDYSASGVRRSIEESCARLGVEGVDIALVHDPDDHFTEALDQAIPALAELKGQGVVAAVGVAMNQTAMLEQFVRRADLDCVLVAGRWSLLDRSAGEALLPLCLEHGVGVLVAGVLNSGILADPRPGATYDYKPAPAQQLAAARRLQDICARYGVPLRAAALQWPLRHAAVTATVVGARSPEELSDDVDDMGGALPDDLWDELDELRLP